VAFAAVAWLALAGAARSPTLPPSVRTDIPVVLVPGWFDTARELAALRIRLRAAGWAHVETLTFRDPTGSNRDHAEEIDALVSRVLAETGADEVDIVAHSMGGLATRQAQGGTVDGRPVSDSLAHVVTIGTPFRGAQLLGFGGGLAGDIAAELIDTALRVCSTDFNRRDVETVLPRRRPSRTFCGLLGATETSAVQGMIPDSAELEALPEWRRDVRIVPMAAEIEIGVGGPFGFSESFSVGDFAVSVRSATADASPGVRPFVARCHASLFGIVDAIDDSPCSHANELANRRIIRHVREAVRRGVRTAS
jgi:pimeloyl-ACP methyl ester carboxylesterase